VRLAPTLAPSMDKNFGTGPLPVGMAGFEPAASCSQSIYGFSLQAALVVLIS
jgi:hypothetical protein